MMKGATPVKQNQGTDARQQNIILAMPKLALTEFTDLHRKGNALHYSLAL